MQAAELVNEWQAVDGDYLTVRETFFQLRQRIVISRVFIGGDQYGTIDDEKVGIGGGQAVAILVEFRARLG